MNITDFNFIPTAYDRIAFTETGEVDITSPWLYEFITLPTEGLFLPILAVSLDGSRWYSQFYPPMDSNGNQLASVSFVIGTSEDISFGLTRPSVGKVYYKIMGLEL